MFMKTIAVGPFDEVASWVTGGTTVAIDRLGGASRKICFKGACCVHIAVVLLRLEVGEVLQSCDIGFRNTIIDSKVTMSNWEGKAITVLLYLESVLDALNDASNTGSRARL